MWEFLESQLRNQFFTGAALGGLLAGAVVALRNLPNKLYNLFLDYFTVSVTWNSFDPLYPAVQEWLHQHEFHRWRRNFQATTAKKNREHQAESLADGIPTTVLAPYNGSYTLKIQKRWFRVTSTIGTPTLKEGIVAQRYEEISLRYIGRDLRVIQRIIKEVREYSDLTRNRGVPVFVPSYCNWRRLKTAQHRTLDSVVLPSDCIEGLRDDIEAFLDREDEYCHLGVPFHRGYLLSGPPGTGKTSAAMALASTLQLPLYVLPLANFIRGSDDNGSLLTELVSDMLTPAIVLIEDIDRIPSATDQSSTLAASPTATLINILDGVTSKHGVMTIITTNKPHTIDPVLIRPGRVDVHIEFTHCDVSMAKRMVQRFFPSCSVAEVDQIARSLVDLSPATVQELLLRCNGNHRSFVPPETVAPPTVTPSTKKRSNTTPKTTTTNRTTHNGSKPTNGK